VKGFVTLWLLGKLSNIYRVVDKEKYATCFDKSYI